MIELSLSSMRGYREGRRNAPLHACKVCRHERRLNRAFSCRGTASLTDTEADDVSSSSPLTAVWHWPRNGPLPSRQSRFRNGGRAGGGAPAARPGTDRAASAPKRGLLDPPAVGLLSLPLCDSLLVVGIQPRAGAAMDVPSLSLRRFICDYPLPALRPDPARGAVGL